MIYYIYQLNFISPVHFGRAELGGKLENTDFSFTADMMFNALCCELSSYKSKYLSQFIQKCEQGNIVLSDLFPYRDKAGSVEFYLPKPCLPLAAINAKFKLTNNFVIAGTEVLEKKQIENMRYLRAGSMTKYFSRLHEGRIYANKENFAVREERTLVNCRGQESMPYTVSIYNFKPDTGLYGIIGLADSNDIEWLTSTIESIGFSGIGGKCSSGFGKFKLADTPYDLNDGGFDVDDKAIADMLLTKSASWQMCLGNLLPQKQELSELKDAYYKLRRYGGFTTSQEGNCIQKNSVYMLEAGSCLKSRISGQVQQIGYEGHPILRYGKGIYAGICP